jgi:proline dehydrogenase
MLEGVPRTVFSLLASSARLTRLASRYGMRRPDSFARRFVAGEAVAEALETARVLEAHGLQTTLDLLGESVHSIDSAALATTAYVETIGAIERAGTCRNISLKLTQLGLEVDPASSIDNLRRVLDIASAAGFFVRIDMEGSAFTEATLDAFETVRGMGYQSVGVVIQSYLRRSERDLRRVLALGGTVRLVKGAYREPRTVAYQDKSAVDASFIELMRVLLSEGRSPAIATHDPAMIDATRTFAASQGIGKDRFEFQMLYGIRRDLQASLSAEGYRVRVYVPFGRDWFPYFMRRLGERPANVGFVLKSVWRDKDPS